MVRNPIRLKNLNSRFLPYYVAGALLFLLAHPSPASYASGAVLVLAGAALRSWGAGHLVKNDRLTISGPYAWLRHPLYAGTLLVAVGYAVVLGGLYTGAALAFVVPWFFVRYFPRKERAESERLASIYGRDFEQYRDHVNALVPAFSPWRPAPATLADADPGLRWSAERYSDNNELGALIAILAGLALLATGL